MQDWGTTVLIMEKPKLFTIGSEGTSAEIVKYSQQQQCTLVKVWDLDVGMRFSHRMPGTVIWQTWYVWREHGMC